MVINCRERALNDELSLLDCLLVSSNIARRVRFELHMLHPARPSTGWYCAVDKVCVPSSITLRSTQSPEIAMKEAFEPSERPFGSV